MAISEDDVARVRAAASLVDIAGEHVALRKVGRRWMGLCPFHAEKSGSFSVNGEEGLYYCYGCHAKGDVITFVREIEHLDFVGAMERLAARTGIELHYDNEAIAKDRQHRKALTSAMEQAVEWYHQRLLTAPDASAARSYLRERGYDGEVVRQFRIGWAPQGWDELANALRLPERVLKDTGLGFVNRRGRTNDAFRGRILFPIFDAGGNPVAFGGRILPGAEGPKYKNSAETALYAKSRTLYGLNWAKGDVVNSGEVVVCEGYTDVIAFFTSGVPRAVATCGTALTEEHVRTLKNFATRIVLAYDADGAGQAAAERFYEWERKLGIDIVVASLPTGTDPADAARRDPELLRSAVAGAKPFLGFRVARALAAGDLSTVEGRARAADRCLEMLREHPNPLVRDEYLMEVASRCRIDAERLRERLASVRPGEGGASAPREPLRPQRVAHGGREGRDGGPEVAELQALRMAVHRPEDLVALFDVISPPEGMAGIEDVLFVDPRARAAFRALLESPTLIDAIGRAEPEASELLSRLAVEEVEGNAADEFLRLVEQAAERSVKQLHIEAKVSLDALREVAPTLAWLKLGVESLRDPERAPEAAAAIVGWLIERAKGDG